MNLITISTVPSNRPVASSITRTRAKSAIGGRRSLRAVPHSAAVTEVLASGGMSSETRRIGRCEVSAIVDADLPDLPMSEAFPDIPARELETGRSAYAGVYTEDDRWRLRVRAWVR